MNEPSTALTTQHQNLAIQTLDEMDTVAKKLSASGLMGPKTTPEMVYGLMLLCQCEGLNPISAMKRYHIVEGRPSMRADAMQAEFLAKGGAIIFHVRSDAMVAATLFADKSRLDDAARKRATERFEAMWRLDAEPEENKKSKLMMEVAKHSMDGEETVIRTLADAIEKGITQGANGMKANWRTSPRQMLTARVITEGVRLVNPGLIVGIYSEDETADIVRQERLAKIEIINNPTPENADKLMEMLQELDDQLRHTDITDGERKRLQGERSDLSCRLHDMGIKPPVQPEASKPTVGGQPAKTVETTVIPPEESKKPAPATRTRKPAPTPTVPAEDNLDMTPSPTASQAVSWETTVCHIGKAGGQMNGKTLRQIFDRVPAADGVDAQVDWFRNQKLPTATSDADRNLWAKVQEAGEARRAELTGSAPKAAASTQTTPATPEATKQPAGPQRWQDYTIPGKHPDYSGKVLGTLDPAQIKEINDTYLPQIDWTRASLDQKKLKAMIALALADLTKNTEQGPQAGDVVDAEFDVEPEHTTALREAIESTNLNRNDFMKVCKANGWIDKAHQTLEEITDKEVIQLTHEWAEVAKAVKAEQP